MATQAREGRDRMGWDRNTGTDPKYRKQAHTQARAALIARFTPGDPCCLCGHPMWPHDDGTLSHLHADHDPTDDTRYRGLAHGSEPCQTCGVKCNITDGSRRGRARQITTTLTW